MEIKEFYKTIWNGLNTFGRITIFPLMCVMCPVFFVLLLCFKKD